MFLSLARIPQVLPWDFKNARQLDIAAYDEICSASIRFADACLVLSHLAYIVFASLRTLALYDMKKPIFGFLFALGLLDPAVQVFLLAIGHTAINTDIGLGGPRGSPVPLGRMNCYHRIRPEALELFGDRLSSSIGYILFALRMHSVIFDALVIGMTWRKTFSSCGLRSANARAPISRMLVRDGTSYFLAIALVSMLNGVGVLITCPNIPTPTNLHFNVGMLALASSGPVADTIASICMSRFMLRLRAVAQEDHASQHRPWVTVHFAAMAETLVGDMGVELSDGTVGDADAANRDICDTAMCGEAVLGGNV